MKNINVSKTRITFRDAVMTFAGPTSGAVHLT